MPNEKPFDIKTLAGSTFWLSPMPAARPSELSAFTELECDAVRDWGCVGGNWLLIVTHHPKGHAVAGLAKRLGVHLSKGGWMYWAKPAKYWLSWAAYKNASGT